MAKFSKSNGIDDFLPDSNTVEEVATSPSTPTGPVPGTVRIHNLKPDDLQIILAGSIHFRLKGFKPGGTGHISHPIPKNQIPEAYKKLARQGKVLKIVEEV